MKNLILFCVFLIYSKYASTFKMVCYWDTSSLIREGDAYFGVEQLKGHFPFCTHVIVGFLDIKNIVFRNTSFSDYQIQLLNTLSTLQRPPGLKMYLGVGCGVSLPTLCDVYKYHHMMIRSVAWDRFVHEMVKTVVKYQFDGIDLSWPFLRFQPNSDSDRSESQPGPSRASSTSDFSLQDTIDPAYRSSQAFLRTRQLFADLIKVLGNRLKMHQKDLTITVLPRLHAINYDIKKIGPLVEAFHILGFDYKSPYNQPRHAQYTSPLFGSHVLLSDAIDPSIREWLREVPSHKLVLGIPTFARTWAVNVRDIWSRVHPPYPARGRGGPGPLTHCGGMLAYYEACPSLLPGNGLETPTKWLPVFSARITDQVTWHGAWRLGLSQRGVTTWATYDPPEVIVRKVSYAKEMNLGGIGIYELSLDDFRGACIERPVFVTAWNASNT